MGANRESKISNMYAKTALVFQEIGNWRNFPQDVEIFERMPKNVKVSECLNTHTVIKLKLSYF